jgi:hypothetical protein
LDLAILLGLCLSLGLLAASHVALVAALMARQSRVRGLLALVVPPLAPIWGFEERMHKRAALWVAAFAVHVVCLISAAIGGGVR